MAGALPSSCAGLDQELRTADNLRVSYWEAEPGAESAQLVERVCFSRDEGEAPFPSMRVVPDGHVDVLFATERGGACAARVFGLKTRALVVATERASDNVLLRLRPGAAERLFGLSASELVDRAPELGELWRGARELCERIAEAAAPAERQALAERALARLGARTGDESDLVLHRFVSEIRRSRGALRVGALADRLGLGARKLERLCLARLGCAPKTYARIVRFHAAYRALAAGESPVDAALAHGYFDQAHLNRDFSELAGAPPRRIFPSARGPATDSLPA
jgi:AraC-like DNA-binding protein